MIQAIESPRVTVAFFVSTERRKELRSEWGLGLWCLDHKYGPPPAALRGPARLGRREVRAMACFVLCQLQQWVDNREGGQEFRAQAIPSPLGVPRTGNRMSSEGGIGGRMPLPASPQEGEIPCLFSQASFSRNTSIWQRMVRGPCLGGVYACLLHG